MNIIDFIQNNKELDINKYNFPIKGSFVYLICEENGDIIYIGCTTDPPFRFKCHYAKIEFNNKPIYFFPYSDNECIELEKELIVKIKPKHNIMHNANSLSLRKLEKEKIEKNRGMTAQKKENIELKSHIKNIMSQKNISQADLSRSLGTSRQRIHQILHEDTGLSPMTLDKIAKILGFDPRD